MGGTSLEDFLPAPALRALGSIGVTRIADFRKHTRFEIQELHGIGARALKDIERGMAENRVEYKDEVEDPKVTEYINAFSGTEKRLLVETRTLIRTTIPKAKEKMAYGMPTYYYGENIVHFAGFKQHIGLFPTPDGILHFKRELERFQSSKGAIQFRLDEALPTKLIKEIVEYRFTKVRE